MRIGLACATFLKILFNAQFASMVKRLSDAADPASGPGLEAESPAPSLGSANKPAKRTTARSEAITLLATLQREARFVDLVKEPLGDYSDAQVGAAARDVLRDCSEVLDRLFGIAPAAPQQEGAELEVPAGYDAGCFRLTGNASGEPPFRGRLVHHGWVATRCAMPVWSGSQASQMVIAPQELEV